MHLVSHHESAPVTAHRNGVTVEPWHLPPFHLKRFWLTIQAIRRLRETAARFQPHLTQVHFLGSGAWYAALAGLRPLALWIMGGDITGAFWKPASKREAVLSRLALRRADLVVSWSEHLRELVSPFVRTGVPNEVVVGGVDVTTFRPCAEKGAIREALGLPRSAFLILSARLLWPLYNIDVIVAALPYVRRDQPDAILAILAHSAGRFAEYAAEIRRRVALAGLADAVFMLPAVEHGQVARYFAAADCTISIPDTDGTPMSVLESLASGTPAIVHDLPQYDRELFAHEDTVLRVPLRDPRALAEGILRLAREPALRSALARRGRELVEKRASYEGEMQRLEQLYRDLVEGRRA